MYINVHQNRLENGKKRKRLFIWIAAGVAILIALLLVLHQLGYIRFPWDQKPEFIVSGGLLPDLKGEDGALPGMSEEELLAQMQRVADAAQFSYKINARPVFETGSSQGDWNIENPNYNAYPIAVQVTLDDTGELIFDSGGMLPNQHIAKAKLEKALKAGTYPATATIHMYHPETHKEVGKTQAGLVITVLH